MIKNCYTTCNVTGSGSYIGGIAGNDDGKVQYCYATGTVTGATNVGGISGMNNGSYAVERCVALNSEVSVTSATGDVGRIVGNSGWLANNYARASGMTLKRNGVTISPTETTLTGRDGADIGETNTYGANSDTWWSGTTGYSTELWDFANNRLPHLKTITGEAFSEGQEPAVE